MASGHEGAVIRNSCYTAPRHPRTDKPATINERARSSLEIEPLEGLGLSSLSEGNTPSSRRHKRHHQGHKPKLSVRDSLSQSLRELDDVGEEHFYDHLLALKNEHKKTLKAVEKLYYSEKDRQGSGFQLDSRTKLAVSDYDGFSIPKQFPLRDYDPFIETTEDQEKDNTHIPVRPEDHIRDMSVRDERTIEDKENEGMETFSFINYVTNIVYRPLYNPNLADTNKVPISLFPSRITTCPVSSLQGTLQVQSVFVPEILCTRD